MIISELAGFTRLGLSTPFNTGRALFEEGPDSFLVVMGGPKVGVGLTLEFQGGSKGNIGSVLKRSLEDAEREG